MISISNTTSGNAYADAVAAAGGIPVTAYAYQGNEAFDGLLLAGGGDIDPAYYGETNHGSYPPDRTRDRCEMSLCRHFTEAKKPILAICRGCQLLNVFLGGTLVQDLPHHAACNHLTTNQENSVAYQIFGKESLVNSNHHQAIKQPAMEIKITQRCKQDGVIEGFEHERLPILATQWHPEQLNHTLPLFEHFLCLFRK